MSTLSDLVDYFENVAEGLAGKKKVSEIFPNMTDAGSERADILLELLNCHLPRRCDVIKGGFIFDSNDAKSKQIDLIITSDSALQFRQQHKSFTYVEGAYGAISVKSKLDKRSFEEALHNLASIPPMPELQPQNFAWVFRKKPSEFSNLPLKVIFAFDGIKHEKILKYLELAYSGEQSIPENRYPDLIIVNQKYIIFSPIRFSIDEDMGNPREAWRIFSGPSHVGAYSLIHLLARLQYYANLGSFMVFPFFQYEAKLGGLIHHKYEKHNDLGNSPLRTCVGEGCKLLPTQS